MGEKFKGEVGLEKMRGRQMRMLEAMAVILAMNAGITTEAKAKEAKTPETKELQSSIVKETGEIAEGRVVYVQKKSEGTKVGEMVGTETVTGVNVHDEGDPDIKGDEIDYSARFYRFAEDGTKIVEQKGRILSEGSEKLDTSPFATLLENTSWMSARKGFRDNKQRSIRGKVRGFNEQLVIIRAMRAVGMGESNECKGEVGSLLKGLERLQERYPEAPISHELITEIRG